MDKVRRDLRKRLLGVISYPLFEQIKKGCSIPLSDLFVFLWGVDNDSRNFAVAGCAVNQLLEPCAPS
jgi:hypothetical protein